MDRLKSSSELTVKRHFPGDDDGDGGWGRQRRRDAELAGTREANQQLRDRIISFAPAYPSEGFLPNKVQFHYKRVGVAKVCDFYVPSNDDAATLVIHCSLRDMAATNDYKARATYYASLMSLFSGDFKTALDNRLSDMGISKNVIRLPDEAATHMINIDGQRDYSSQDAEVLLGCGILIAFRNISEQSYDRFMADMIRGIRASIGYPDEGVFECPFPFAVANILTSSICVSLELKRAYIQFVLQGMNSGTQVGSLCSYLDKVISWSGMSSFVLMYEVLVQTRSAALSHPLVHHEVVRLLDIYIKIFNSSHPRYYRYECSAADANCLDRTNFAVLVSVAEIIKHLDGHASVKQFAAPVSRHQRRLIEELVRIP